MQISHGGFHRADLICPWLPHMEIERENWEARTFGFRVGIAFWILSVHLSMSNVAQEIQQPKAELFRNLITISVHF